MIRKPHLLGILFLAAGLSVTDVQAQTATQGDLQALIFYLQNDDETAVRAELRRLRAQFPDWTPPADLNELLGASAAVDETPIWQHMERGDWGAARAAIEQTRMTVPNWSAGTEMLQALELGEAQARFDRAVAEGRPEAVIAVARQNPGILRCDRINNAWQVAEMYRMQQQSGNALATYRGVLGSCTGASDTEATLEKANEIASLEQLTSLFDTARNANSGNVPRLNALEERLRAGRGAPPSAQQETASGGQGQATGGAATAQAPASPTPAQTQTAPTQQALAAPVAPSGGTATAPAGELGRLPLRGDGRVSQVRSAKEAGAWQQCLAGSNNPRSIELLYERSWCAYNLQRPLEALAGFTATARSGNALGGNVNRDAHFGMILSYLEVQMTEEAARVAAVTNLTETQRIEVEATILDQRGVRAYRLGEYRQAAAYFTALQNLTGSLRRDLAIMRAYAYLNAGARDTALEEFTRLHSELATEETRAGINAAQF